MNSVLDTAMFQGIRVANTVDVESKFTERRIPKNGVLMYQGEPGVEMYVIKSGSFKIYREEGSKEIVLGHQFAGEMIGELEALHHDNTRLASVSALESSVVWSIRKADLEELITAYPEIWRKVFYVLSERLAQADRKIRYLAFLETSVRAANLLLDLYSNFGVVQEDGTHLIDWKITQQYFSSMIGVTRESTTRAITELQQDGIIRYSSGIIQILDLSKLSQRAGAAYEPTPSRKWHPSL